MDNNQNQTVISKKNKALIFIIAISLLVIFIVAVSLLMAKNIRLQDPRSAEEIKATKEAEALNEAKAKIAIKNRELAAEQASQETANNTNTAGEPVPATVQNQGEAEQASQETANVGSVTPEDVNAPAAPINGSRLAGEVLKININGSGFTPSSFEAQAGTKVIMEITNTDKTTHNLSFSNPMLDRFNTTIAPGEKSSITIKTPSTPGTYTFSCTVPGHNAEIGKMIVK